MKRSLLVPTLLAATALLPSAARADDLAATPPTPPAEHTTPRYDASKAGASLGMDLRRFQDDFGIGATVSTPELWRWFRLTLGGGVAWYPHGVASNGNEEWDMLGHGRLVVEVGPTFQLGIPVRPYGFGGTAALLLPRSLSNQGVAFGGVGGFGVELAFMSGALSGPVTYFMEVGGCGYDATASKLPTNPNIASGLLLGAGLRVYL
ncbi:MAG TPA: hypothetical protein VIF15_17470 [Polyangiaceae bacterium]